VPIDGVVRPLWREAVVGADRYRNPDEDLPADFVEKRTAYYAALGLPLDSDGFISGLQEERRAALSQLEAGIGDQDRTVALCV
jgi:hypothetical protein